MRNTRSSYRHALLALVSCTLFTACASGPAPRPQGSPHLQAGQGYALGKAAIVQQTNGMQRHLDEAKSILYYQPFGGGGVALGLLLGPIGVAANAGMIEKQTEADVSQLYGKLGLDATTLFTQVMHDSKRSLIADAEAKSAITPYVYVTKISETSLRVGAAMWLDGQSTTAGQRWSGKYMYILPTDYTVESLARLDAAQRGQLQEQLRVGYSQLLAFMESDDDGAIAKEMPVRFKSAVLTPRFEFEQLGSLAGERVGKVWLRGTNGIFAMDKADVSWTPVAH